MRARLIFKCTGVFIFAILLILNCFFLPVLAEPQSDNTAPGFEQIAVQGNLKLYLNYKTTDFCVENTLDGSMWYSSPTDSEKDTLATGVYRTEMSSVASFAYYDDTGVLNNENTYSGSVLDDNFEIEKKDNGFVVDYNVGSNVIKLPIKVELTTNGLSVTAMTSELQMKKDYSLESISLLPYFASAKQGDEGYFVFPDGSGAIMDFSSDKAGIPSYEARIYGDDITNEDTYLSDLDKTRISLPVFGIRKNGSAMLCRIDQGEALSSIVANGAGNITSRHNAYAKFNLYGNMKYQFSSSYTVIFEKLNKKLTDVGVSFTFLSAGSADYSGMARTYRDYLISTKVLKEQAVTASPLITVYGGIMAKKSVFGMLVDSVAPLTTSKQLLTLADKANESGIEKPKINLINWNKDELSGKAATSFRANGNLFKGISLSELEKNDSYTLVPTVSNVLSYTKPSSILGRFSASSSNIAGVAFYKKAVSPTTYLEYGPRHYFLNERYLKKYTNKFIESALKSKDEYLGLSDMVNMLYEDFGKTTMKRNDMQTLLVSSLKKLSQSKKLLLDNPNLYALEFADEVINIPISSSGHILFDRDIPFYQMVLSGCLRYSSEPLNHMDSNLALLKVIESGSMPHFFMYYAEESMIKNTDYSSLTGGCYKGNIEKLSEIYRASSEVFKKTGCTAIVSHDRIAENVYKVSYANGCDVYVNYSEKDFTLPSGNVVKSLGYYAEV